MHALLPAVSLGKKPTGAFHCYLMGAWGNLELVLGQGVYFLTVSSSDGYGFVSHKPISESWHGFLLWALEEAMMLQWLFYWEQLSAHPYARQLQPVQRMLDSPIQTCTFFTDDLFFFSFCSIFSAAAIILNNISPPVAEALQCNGELFWRYKSLDLKNLPGVSVLCTTFLLCWSLYLAHAKEHLTFKDPFCTSSKCLHPLLLD